MTVQPGCNAGPPNCIRLATRHCGLVGWPGSWKAPRRHRCDQARSTGRLIEGNGARLRQLLVILLAGRAASAQRPGPRLTCRHRKVSTRYCGELAGLSVMSARTCMGSSPAGDVMTRAPIAMAMYAVRRAATAPVTHGIVVHFSSWKHNRFSAGVEQVAPARLSAAFPMITEVSARRRDLGRPLKIDVAALRSCRERPVTRGCRCNWFDTDVKSACGHDAASRCRSAVVRTGDPVCQQVR